MPTADSVTLRLGRTAWQRRPRVVAIDVDHTLIRDDHTLAQATVDAVAHVRAAGVQVVLASSRPPGGMRQFLQTLGLVSPVPFVGFQGAFVGSYDAAGALVTHATSPLDAAVARDVVAAASDSGMAVNWYTPDGWFVDRLSDGVLEEARIVGMEPQVTHDFAALPAPLKLLFIAEAPPQVEALRPHLPSNVTAETSKPTYLEITASGVDKATGVRVAAELDGATLEETVALGDGYNDLGLFRRVSGAIAPANAVPDVIAAADYVTASNNDDGVAIALRWITDLPA